MKHHYQKIGNLLPLFIVLFFITGCFQSYYMASSLKYDNLKQKAAIIDSLKSQDKYFILRNGSAFYSMEDITLSQDNGTLTTTLETLPSDHRMYINKDRKGKLIYKKRNPNDLEVLDEVHLYVASDSAINEGSHNISLNDIQKIEVIQKDKEKTSSSFALGILGIVGGLGVSVFILYEIAMAEFAASL